jgi:hypothetical protein
MNSASPSEVSDQEPSSTFARFATGSGQFLNVEVRCAEEGPDGHN